MSFKKVNTQRQVQRDVALALIRAYIKKHKRATVEQVSSHLNLNGIHVSERTIERYRVIVNRRLARESLPPKPKPKPKIIQKPKIEDGYVICPLCRNKVKLSNNPIALVGCAGQGHLMLDYYPKERVWRYAHSGKVHGKRESGHVIGGTKTW